MFNIHLTRRFGKANGFAPFFSGFVKRVKAVESIARGVKSAPLTNGHLNRRKSAA